MFKGEKCLSPVFTEDELKAIVVKAVNQLYEIKDDVLSTFNEIMRELGNTENENKSLDELSAKLECLVKDQKEHLERLKSSKQDITVWHNKNDEIETMITKTKEKIVEIQTTIREKEACKLELDEFIEYFNSIKGEITEFSDDLLFGLVEVIEASKEKVEVVFKNGTNISI